jgi:hypothetical protein
MLNRKAASEVLGMTQIVGGHLAIAEAMAPSSEVAVTIAGDKDPALMTELHICQNCFLKGRIDLAILIEDRSWGFCMNEICRSRPEEDFPVSYEILDSLAKRHVDMQGLRVALKAKGETAPTRPMAAGECGRSKTKP